MRHRFELVEGTSSKFWEVEVTGSKMTVRFGRIGTSGQEKTKVFGSASAASKEADKLVAEKAKKGYSEVASRSSARKPASAKKPETASFGKHAAVQKKVLVGRAVPHELAVFLSAGRSAFFGEPDYGEVTFLSGPATSTDHYVDSADGEVWATLFAEIVWIAEEADGGLIGYYHGGAKSLDEAPIVYLSNEGSFTVTGRTLVDHFAWRKGDELDELEAFCTKSKLPGPMTTKAREASVKGVKSLDVRFRELKKAAAKAAPKASQARPVDRYPSMVAMPDDRVVVVSSQDDVTERKSDDAHAAFAYAGGAFTLLPETPFNAYLCLEGAGVHDGKAIFVMVDETARVMSFDPAENAWTAGPELKQPHKHAGVALVANGKVMVAGGEVDYPTKTDKIHLYDLAKQKWSQPAKLGVARERPATAVLPDGRVLLFGGEVEPDDEYNTRTDVCEVFDPAKGTCKPIAKLKGEYSMASAAVLRDGRVVLATQEGRCAIYDPKADKWSKAVEDERISTPLVVLGDGRVAFFHWNRHVMLLDPKTLKLSKGGETLLPRGFNSSAAALPDGRVLLVGGKLYDNIANEPELWDPATGTGSAVPGFEKAMDKQVKALAKRAK